MNITVIVNPDSGPGSLPYPNADYTPAIQKLNTYSNIRSIGYVKTGYGTRNTSDIVRDINTYSRWSANSSSIAMHGIFFDEVVYEYSASAPQYMKTIDQAAKNAAGLLEPRTVSFFSSLPCATRPSGTNLGKLGGAQPGNNPRPAPYEFTYRYHGRF